MYRAIGLIVFLPLFAACDTEQAKLDCPQPQPDATSATAIQETAEQIKQLQQRLADDVSGNVVDEVIAGLKKTYPEASDAEVTNYLMAAYCPALASAGLSQEEADAKMEQFGSQVYQSLSQ